MCSKDRGLTLTELLLSTILIGIVMLGVISTDFAVRRVDRNAITDVTSNMQMAAISEAIRADIRRVHGFLDPALDSDNTGVWIDLPNKTICFRYDDGPPYTPEVYTDDRWSCYTQPGAGTAIYQCDLASTGNCTAANNFMGNLVSDQFTNATAIPSMIPVVNATQTTGEFSFNMTLVTRDTPSAGAVVDGGNNLTTGTVDNYQIFLKMTENIGTY